MIFISKSFRTIVFDFIVCLFLFFHNISPAVSSGILQVPQVESFLWPDKHGIPKKGRGYSGRKVMKKQ